MITTLKQIWGYTTVKASVILAAIAVLNEIARVVTDPQQTNLLYFLVAVLTAVLRTIQGEDPETPEPPQPK